MVDGTGPSSLLHGSGTDGLLLPAAEHSPVHKLYDMIVTIVTFLLISAPTRVFYLVCSTWWPHTTVLTFLTLCVTGVGAD